MPITYDIDSARALVRTACIGFVTFQDVLEHFAKLESDPRRAGAFDVLIDLRGLTSMPKTGQLRQAAERIAPERSALQYGACAIVAFDPVQVSVGKLFAVFARERFRASNVLPTIEEAERWLQDRQASSN